MDRRSDIEVEVRRQRADQRPLKVRGRRRRAPGGLDAMDSFFVILALLLLAPQVTEQETVRVVWSRRPCDGSDLDRDPSALTFVQSNPEATGDETTTNPGAEDVAEVEGDGTIGPALDLSAGVDESLDGGGVDVGDGGEIEDDGTEDGFGQFVSSGFDVAAAWRVIVPGAIAELSIQD